VIVRMWEVIAQPEAQGDVLSFVCEVAVPALEVRPLHVDSQVLTSTDGRVVVVSRWRGDPVDPESPPRYKIAHPARSWDFHEVDR
jgi:hypothetical protein